MPSPQLTRQWNVLQELAASRRGRTLDDLAEVTGTSPRTARRDVEDLQGAGFPVETLRDGHSIRYRLSRGARLPEVPFAVSEALALHYAALSSPFFANPNYHPLIRAALGKLNAALPLGVRDYLGRFEPLFSHGTAAQGSEETLSVLRVLQEQIVDRCRVLLSYRNLRGQASERTVDPYCLRVHGRDLYLLGHCHLRGEPRVFRVDRIAAADPLDEEYRLPAGFDPEAFLATSLGVFLGEPGQAVVRFDGVAARFVAEHPLHPEQQVLESGEDHLVVRLPYRGDVEILMAVQRYGQSAEVLGPPELRDRARTEVEGMRARYGEPDVE